MFRHVRCFTIYSMNSAYSKEEILRCCELIDQYRISRYLQLPKHLILGWPSTSEVEGSYYCSTQAESDEFIQFARAHNLKFFISDSIKSSLKELTKVDYLHLEAKDDRFVEDEEQELFYNTPYRDRLMGKIRLNQVKADSTTGGFMDNYCPLRLVLSTKKSSKRDIFCWGPRYIVRRWLMEKMQAQAFTGVRYEPCLQLGQTYSEAERYIGGGDIPRLTAEADFFELIVTQRTLGPWRVRGVHSLWLLDQLDRGARVSLDGQLWLQEWKRAQIELESAEEYVVEQERRLQEGNWYDKKQEQQVRQTDLPYYKARVVYLKHCLEALDQPLTEYVSSYAAEYSYFNPDDLVAADFQEAWLLDIEGVGVRPRKGPFETIVSSRVYQFWRQEKVAGLYSYHSMVPIAGKEFSHEA